MGVLIITIQNSMVRTPAVARLEWYINFLKIGSSLSSDFYNLSQVLPPPPKKNVLAPIP